MKIIHRRILRLSAGWDGGIAIMAAILLPMIIGFAALSVEYGYGLLVRDETQRTADLASYAGALAYSDTSSLDRMTSAALHVAKLNGVEPANTTVALAASPKDTRLQAVHVEVKTTNRLFLAPVLAVDSKLDVAAEAYSPFGAKESGCIIALAKSGTGVTLSGGVQVGAPNCYVASNSALRGKLAKAHSTRRNAAAAGEQWKAFSRRRVPNRLLAPATILLKSSPSGSANRNSVVRTTTIREIRGWAPSTPAPHSPPDVVGVMNLRGLMTTFKHQRLDHDRRPESHLKEGSNLGETEHSRVYDAKHREKQASSGIANRSCIGRWLT